MKARLVQQPKPSMRWSFRHRSSGDANDVACSSGSQAAPRLRFLLGQGGRGAAQRGGDIGAPTMRGSASVKLGERVPYQI
ncbi:hypothetical protein GUJ93_ZPchr0011g27036 [Zizania palustris]|uniref:Uncharacterized protein n=1 Tax=Zizania palustris TaxID=103762 RepID=A0A8J6BPR5_ZIZPA|nr:hypothetical protein GUJ93_ZPchr0011g27036 [Zizania palustris]